MTDLTGELPSLEGISEHPSNARFFRTSGRGIAPRANLVGSLRYSRLGTVLLSALLCAMSAANGFSTEVDYSLAPSYSDQHSAPYVAPTTFGPPVPPIENVPRFTPVVDADMYLDLSGPGVSADQNSTWFWQLLPTGIIYHSYMASVHESRLSGTVFELRDDGTFFDVSLGGRVGIARYGTASELHPQGWQLDMEGAAFPRLALDHNWDVEATDFRFGVPLTYGIDNYQYKFSYYHLSSHLGDEFAIRNPGSLASRINYSRDALVLGVSWFPNPAWRIYTEADWAFHFDDGNLPWEFQFGIDCAAPGPTGAIGTPFFAVNGHIREAVDFGGNFVVQTGWLWRGGSGHTLRAGFHYFNGKSSQFEFFDQFEQQIGFGIWYDQ